jgi:hypothetical protein
MTAANIWILRSLGRGSYRAPQNCRYPDSQQVRDTDGECAVCMRWYRVGESFKSYASLDDFLARAVLAQPEADAGAASEEDVSYWLLSLDVSMSSDSGEMLGMMISV